MRQDLIVGRGLVRDEKPGDVTSLGDRMQCRPPLWELMLGFYFLVMANGRSCIMNQPFVKTFGLADQLAQDFGRCMMWCSDKVNINLHDAGRWI